MYRLNLVPSQCVPYTAEFIICTGYNKLFILLHLHSCVLLFLLPHLSSYFNDRVVTCLVSFGSLKLPRHYLLSMLKTVELLNVLVEAMLIFFPPEFHKLKRYVCVCERNIKPILGDGLLLFCSEYETLFCIDQPLFS